MAPSAITSTARHARRPREARHPGHLPRSCALVLLAPSTVMSTAGTRTLFGEAGRGAWGETSNRAVIFRGRGGSGFPPSNFKLYPLLQFVRSAVGVILTSPSLLVEGVRSGSRRRNAATASVLAGGGIGPKSRRLAPAWASTTLCG